MKVRVYDADLTRPAPLVHAQFDLPLAASAQKVLERHRFA
jgi:hypothetical protein